MKGRAPGIPVQTEGPLQAVLLLCVGKLGGTFFITNLQRERERIREMEEGSHVLVAIKEPRCTLDVHVYIY